MKLWCKVGVAVVVCVWGPGASGDVFNMPPGQTSLEFVTVGDSGNDGEPCSGIDGWQNGVCGAVAYTYQVGKFEITTAQYTEFLNAVAADDTYGLYDPSMASDLNIAGIDRSGSPGSYTYDVIGSPNHPIAYINWGRAARFANWLSNGQPSGAQDLTTTEDGSYYLNGAVTNSALLAVTRKPDALFVIPTEDEWYKAARYDPTPGAGGGTNYWLYPMRTDGPVYSDQPPGIDAPNPAHTGNFRKDDDVANGYDDGYAVTGSNGFLPTQNYLTDVGAYTLANSYYGTFDQGGNVYEWNETVGKYDMSERGTLGGSWTGGDARLASERDGAPPTYAQEEIGFRIAAFIFPDCNSNGVPDDQDILAGTSQDCNTNGLPDECDIGVQGLVLRSGGSADTCEGTDPGTLVTSPSAPDPQPALIAGGNEAPECQCGSEVFDADMLPVTTHDNGDTWGDFTTTFELPVGFGDPLMVLRVRADDGAEVYLNGTLLATIDLQPSPPDPAVTHVLVIDQADLFLQGANTLEFYVVNTGIGSFGAPTPRGGAGDCMYVQFEADVTYAAPECNSNGVPDECEPDFDGDGTIDECDDDCDGDGVLNEADVCNNTPPGVAVDSQGRPRGDIDEDCDTDAQDYHLFQQGYTGPLSGGSCP